MKIPESVSVKELAAFASGMREAIPRPPASPAHVPVVETIPESVSVAEIQQANHKYWHQFGPPENTR